MRRGIAKQWPTGIVVPLLCSLYFPFALAQTTNNAAAPRPRVDWNSLKPGIEAALGKLYTDCYKESRWVEVLNSGEIDAGAPVAIVAYCHMGAYTSDTTVILLKEGNPVAAEFRDNGKIIDPQMLTGASVRNGAGVDLYPAQHAVLSVRWQTDDQGRVNSCVGTAYVWTAATRTFDANKPVSDDLSATECANLRKQIDEFTAH